MYLPVVCEGYLVAGAVHDAEVDGVVILLVEPEGPDVALVEDYDGLVVDAARRAEERGTMTGGGNFRATLGIVEVEREGVDAVADLAGEDRERAWLLLVRDNDETGVKE